MLKNFYISTPIYYVNAEPHIGSAYTSLFADMITRYYKLNNYNVKFITGTDEHGLKISQSARKENKTEIEFVNKVSESFKDLIKLMKYEPTNFDFIESNFIRTTNKKHIECVQKVWEILVKNDWIYKGTYQGFYCVSDEAYYEESELIKDKDGNYKTSLGKSVEWKKEESYFFRLSEFQDILLKIYKQFPRLIQPENKKAEMISFISGLTIKDYEKGVTPIKNHLKDLSISRNSFDWGIKIPCDCDNKKLLDDNGDWLPDVKKEEKHIIYVWVDALFNYLSVLGCKDNYKDYSDYWLNNKNKIHLVGKDILKPHAIYWIALLLGFNYSRKEINNIDISEVSKYLPTTIYSHGWITNEGQKISKSLGNVIVPRNEIERIQNNFNVSIDIARDYLKYYLITFANFGNDADYSFSNFIQKINSDLVNKIGNLVKRCLDMIYNNCDKKINVVSSFDDLYKDNFKDLFENFEFNKYIDNVIKLAEETNKYFDSKEPWRLKKENKLEEMKVVLYSVVNSIRKIAILLQPIIPFISSEILKAIGEKEFITFDKLKDNIKDNTINKPTIIIPRLK